MANKNIILFIFFVLTPILDGCSDDTEQAIHGNLKAEDLSVHVGQTCPAGTSEVGYDELIDSGILVEGTQMENGNSVKELNNDVCNINKIEGMGKWQIVRLAGGGSVDGWGYDCKARTSDSRDLGHVMCKK